MEEGGEDDADDNFLRLVLEPEEEGEEEWTGAIFLAQSCSTRRGGPPDPVVLTAVDT